MWRLRIAIISRSPLRKEKPLLIALDEKGFVRTFPPLIFPRPLGPGMPGERVVGAGVGTPPEAGLPWLRRASPSATLDEKSAFFKLAPGACQDKIVMQHGR